MAEVQQQSTTRRRGRKTWTTLRVDMTPMVDLAFLLLTFFVLTSELAKENAITTKFPVTEGTTKVGPKTITVLIDAKKICWYRGKFEPSLHLNVVKPGNGLFDVLSQENATVYNQVEVIDRRHSLGLVNDKAWNEKRGALLNLDCIPFVIVKWDEDASYGSVVDAIDDLNRSHNNKYAVVAMTDAERDLMTGADVSAPNDQPVK